ncbi:MAG: hypothetical protein EOM23_05465, partial [Candidatus Moranbacteria bacterium]|nr:hypothetical protein [Candidatus Moranbacteria bacterium]
MKPLFKIFSMVLISLFFGLLIYKTTRFNASSASVAIEFKSQADDILQFFYSNSSAFTEDKSIRINYEGSDEFRTIKIDLPKQHISNLRIDPGAKNKRYIIRKIEIENEKKRYVFSGKEILHHFRLKNLNVVENSNSNILVLRQAEKPDAQLFYNNSLIEEFRSAGQIKISRLQVIIMIIYIILFILVVYRGYKICSWIRQKVIPPGYNISDPRLITVSLYLFPVILKLILVSAQQITALTFAQHDDALFIKIAYWISYGNWLGAYDSLTLVKGFGYPLFIAITNVFGIPLFIAQHLFYALAVFVMVRALSPVLKSKNWEFALFVILLFNPVISSSIFTRILRDGIYFSLTIFVLAGFIGLFLRRKREHQHLSGWAILSGIMLFFHANTREEGIILMPFMIILSILTLIPVFGKSANNIGLPIPASVFKDKIYRVSVIMLPYIILIAGNIVLASANYLAYGGFIRNEIKSEAFSKAYAALTKIETDYWSINVPVPKEARMKAYEISPTFSELKEFLDSDHNRWKKHGIGDPDEIKGGWFLWAFRSAAQNAG